MRKPIKIERGKDGAALNSEAVNAWLGEVNGRATSHTFTAWADVWSIAGRAEKFLEGLGIPKANRAGAEVNAQSGENLSNAYKYTARGTVITLIRRGSGWYLTDVRPYDLYPRYTPKFSVWLTSTQDTLAVAHLREGYSVKPD